MLTVLVLALFAAAAQPSSGVGAVPRLNIEAPAELAAARARLASFGSSRLLGVMRLLRIDDPGPAIRVVLATETSEWARQVPPSTAGGLGGGGETVGLLSDPPPAKPAGHPRN